MVDDKLIRREKEGYYVKVNTWVAVLMFFLVILSSVVSAVTITTSLENQVEHNVQTIEELKDLQTECMQNQNVFRERMAVVETQYSDIKSTLNRIENKVEANR